MTTRARDMRPSEAQRSLLWYLAQGYTLGWHEDSGAAWLKGPRDHRAMAVSRGAALGLERRGLVVPATDAGGFVVAVLTDEGQRVAGEIKAAADRSIAAGG